MVWDCSKGALIELFQEINNVGELTISGEKEPSGSCKLVEGRLKESNHKGKSTL